MLHTVWCVCSAEILVDECTLGLDNCDDNAICVDTDDAFYCTCILGYIGTGDTCEGKTYRGVVEFTAFKHNQLQKFASI